MAGQNQITILHLSDLQFGKNHRFGRLALSAPDDQFDTLFGRLRDDLDLLQREHGLRPDALIVTGDLAEWGKASEFADARDLLVRLSDHLKLPRRHVVIIPGNHDINWKTCEAYFNQCEGDDLKPAPPFTPKWKQYLAMFEDFYKDQPGIRFTIEEPWTLFEMPDLNLVVAGLNSTMPECHDLKFDEKHPWFGEYVKSGKFGHFGACWERQYRWFAERLETFKAKGWLRIGAVHHNYRRGQTLGDENLRDASDLEKFLGDSLNLLLHGHTHEGKFDRMPNGVPILSTGSAALTKEILRNEVSNPYQIIRLRPAKLERFTRCFDPGKKIWGGDKRSSKHNDRWQTEEKVEFVGVHAAFPGSETKVGTARPHGKAGKDRGDESSQFLTRDDPRRESESDRRDDFLARVADVCKFRRPAAAITTVRQPELGLNYLRVVERSETIVRQYPVGVFEHGFTREDLDRFVSEVDAPYRAGDSGLISEIVYSGERPTEKVIREAERRRIRLQSFIEYQGLIDFTPYVQKQTDKLERDTIYPPSLYVPQRMRFHIGQDESHTEDALAQVQEWLFQPQPCFVLILGDFGTGKTFLLHELARRLGRDATGLTPLFVELRALEKAQSLDALVAQHLARSGVDRIDLPAFRYMLQQGRLVLFFDGFDELALRVSYDRAAEHFETLIQAAAGDAKVVVTSRTQHFESERQVRTVLSERAQPLPGLRYCKLQPFAEPQIKRFLLSRWGNEREANLWFDLLKHVKDLLGLSENPRMLSFITELKKEDIARAKQKEGVISAADLYRLLLERWLVFEYERAHPARSQITFTREARWAAITAVALRLWEKTEKFINSAEIAEITSAAVAKVMSMPPPADIAGHLIGSGSLLRRDEEGCFYFVHHSILEWLVACAAAEDLRRGVSPISLGHRPLSPLMVEFLIGLTGSEPCLAWAERVVGAQDQFGPNEISLAEHLMQQLKGLTGREIAPAWKPGFPWIAWLNGSGDDSDVSRLSEEAFRSPVVQVRALRLRNIRVFEDTGVINFCGPQGELRQLALLLGDNAAGKSTLLQSLAIAFTGPAMADKLDIAPERFLRHGAKSGLIEAEFTFQDDAGATAPVKSFIVGIEIRAGETSFRAANRSDCTLLRASGDSTENAAQRLDVLRRLENRPFGFLCAYGPWRNLNVEPKTVLSQHANNFLDRVFSLFHSETLVTDPDLLARMLEGDLSLLRSRPSQDPTDDLRQAMVDAVCQLLPQVARPEEADTSTLSVHGVPVALRTLSDGYGSLLSLLGHLFRHGLEFAEWKAPPNLLHGVVLIDEVDLHLHPNWQRRIISDLGKVFPHLQFIFSSHSPMIAGAVPGESIVVLKREGERVRVRQDAQTVQGWRADQILTSMLFDLESTRDLETSALVQDYTRLAVDGKLSPQQRDELKAIAAKLRLRLPSPEETWEARKAFEMVESACRQQMESLPQGDRERLVRELKMQLLEAVTQSRRPG